MDPTRSALRAALVVGGLVGVFACGEGVDPGPPGGDAGVGADAATGGLPYARGVVSFDPGPRAGFGRDRFPEIVLGPPVGGGTGAGSLDVLTLGIGGEIVLDFGELEVMDGEGPDFVVFENPFWAGGDPAQVFAELGEVSVSADGATWRTFECDVDGGDPGRFPGCAGWNPVLDYDPTEVVPLDPNRTGGDAFDLADIGADGIRFVRVIDRSEPGDPVVDGFDLDAIGLIHFAPASP